MASTPKHKALENTCFFTWLDEFGICHTEVKENSVIELKDAVENKEDVLTIAGEKIPPILVDLRKIKSISKEARDYFAMKNRKPGVKAIAMLIKSPVSKIIGNFFLGINLPSVPTKLFNSETKALNWLKENHTERKQ
ncbi:MAG: hypothetical protein IAF38_20240 [Bacteroidia bacterium]|nr:hypothetical protein [Bacteroidia bacterium]